MKKLQIKEQSSNDALSQFDFGFLDIENYSTFELKKSVLNFDLPFGNVLEIVEVIFSKVDYMMLDEHYKKLDGLESNLSYPIVIISNYDKFEGKDKGEKLFFVNSKEAYHFIIQGMLEEKHQYDFEIIEA